MSVPRITSIFSFRLPGGLPPRALRSVLVSSMPWYTDGAPSLDSMTNFYRNASAVTLGPPATSPISYLFSSFSFKIVTCGKDFCLTTSKCLSAVTKSLTSFREIAARDDQLVSLQRD